MATVDDVARLAEIILLTAGKKDDQVIELITEWVSSGNIDSIVSTFCRMAGFISEHLIEEAKKSGLPVNVITDAFILSLYNITPLDIE